MDGSGTPRSYAEWLKTEGGIEHPTHWETLHKPEQVARIEWLKRACNGVTNILDLGCNWGYVLNELRGTTGMDINPENIEKAKREFPSRHWMVGDITKDMGQFGHDSYAIVVLADVLEHLTKEDIIGVLDEVLRISRRKVLITLPKRQTDDCAYCFKHAWVPDWDYVGWLVAFIAQSAKVILESDDYFFYMEVIKC